MSFKDLKLHAVDEHSYCPRRTLGVSYVITKLDCHNECLEMMKEKNSPETIAAGVPKPSSETEVRRNPFGVVQWLARSLSPLPPSPEPAFVLLRSPVSFVLQIMNTQQRCHFLIAMLTKLYWGK